MTQVFIFDENETMQVVDLEQTPEEIVRTVNKGDWQTYLGFDPAPQHAWQAVRVGRLVIIYPPQPPEDYPRVHLTPREYQVLQALCFGETVEKAAYSLHRSPRSVRNHTNKLRIKFRAKTMPEMLAKATALGLVQPDLDSIVD
jgi:DNA-binding CsgD family transcriptional regulator